MTPEPASEKQLDYLEGLLKRRGVRDGDRQALIGLVYPQGITKPEASAEIEQLKYFNGLPARWIHAYVRQLRRRHSISFAVLVEYLQVAFDGAEQPAGLSRWQQQELIAWLCNPNRSEASAPRAEPICASRRPS
ncbi:MAG: hypothetical protein ETSY1_28490 [Candidatus Entotheonella factor]|uniref:Uncharacterized protein n=2 Tax=Candidatus Entotheonella TaxID=93171 RepID=W4LF42_ENTF1|nr:MAG: hypothetical protein ETSY1_28490 [Candidatus Entotheonella factor]